MNVQGFSNAEKRRRFFALASSSTGPFGIAEFFVLQETHCSSEAIRKQWLAEFYAGSSANRFALFSLAPEDDSAAGVAILYICKSVDQDGNALMPTFDSASSYCDPDGRRCRVGFDYGGHHLLLWSVYRPPCVNKQARGLPL